MADAIMKYSLYANVKYRCGDIKIPHARGHFTRCSRISCPKDISQIPLGIYFTKKRSHD
jgi:hypothetical protein